MCLRVQYGFMSSGDTLLPVACSLSSRGRHVRLLCASVLLVHMSLDQVLSVQSCHWLAASAPCISSSSSDRGLAAASMDVVCCSCSKLLSECVTEQAAHATGSSSGMLFVSSLVCCLSHLCRLPQQQSCYVAACLHLFLTAVCLAVELLGAHNVCMVAVGARLQARLVMHRMCVKRVAG